MNKEVVIPITWNSWDKMDELTNQYYDVEFTNDFGVFLTGEKYSTVYVDYSNGIIEAFLPNSSNVHKSQRMVFKPIN